jgi:hypothetical protein
MAEPDVVVLTKENFVPLVPQVTSFAVVFHGPDYDKIATS